MTTTRTRTRRRKRSLVFVERETCETAGDMEANLPPKQAFPYSNWGPAAALFGVVLALVVGIILGIPAVIIDHPKNEGDLSSTANAFVQFATALGFLIVPIGMAMRGGVPLREALRPARRAPLQSAVGLSLDVRRRGRLPGDRDPLRERDRRTEAEGHRRIVRDAAGADPADRRRRPGQRGGLLPGDALRGAAGEASTVRRRPDRRPDLRRPPRSDRPQRGAAADGLRGGPLPALRENGLRSGPGSCSTC